MAKYRKDRINDAIMKAMTEIIRDVKDPRVSGAFISITGAEATADLKYAKIYYSVLSGDKKEIPKGLRSSAGYIRSCLAKKLNLRVTPELSFIEDSSIAYGAHIESILSHIEFSDDDTEEIAEKNHDEE